MPDELPDSARTFPSAPSSASRSSAVAEELQPVLINLREPLAILRRHLWLLLGITAAVVGAVGYWAYAAVPSYRATAVIRFSDPRQALTGGLAETPLLGSEGADPLLSQVGLLTSRAVAGVVVDSMPILRMRTHDLPISGLGNFQLGPDVEGDSVQFEFGPDSVIVRERSREIRTTYGTPVDLGGIGFTPLTKPHANRATLWVASRESAITRLIAGLRVTLRPHTDIFDVAYVASDPRHAQQVVNRIVAVFRAVNAEGARRQSRLRREFLENQLHVNDSLLAAARRALTAFRDRAGRAGWDRQATTQQADIDQVQLQRQELDAERRMYRGILASLDTAGGRGNREARRAAVSTPTIGANVAVAQFLTQLMQYENARDSLAARSARHPDLPRLSQLITTTEAKLVRAVQSTVQGLTASLDVRIAALDDLRARRAAKVEQLSATDAEAARLEEQVGNAQKIADQLRTEYQRARIAEAVEVGQVEIVDLAVEPTAPLGLSFSEQLALGLLLGLVLGGGTAFLAEHLRSSIGKREEVEELGLPLIGVVPHCGSGRNSLSAKAVGPAIEAFRALRLNVVHSYGAAGPVLFAVSSPEARDGKSFIASNLALAFARGGYQTLLIDGDTRRSTLHTALDAARAPGLTDFLAGRVSQVDILQATEYPFLHFIGSGTHRPDSPELLSSARMSELFGHLRTKFPVIIVDTPPLGAGVDAFALATITGHLLMVIRSGITNRDLVEAKLDLLRRLPVRVLGAVLNDVRAGPEYRGYSYYMEGYHPEDYEVIKGSTEKHHSMLLGRGRR